MWSRRGGGVVGWYAQALDESSQRVTLTINSLSHLFLSRIILLVYLCSFCVEKHVRSNTTTNRQKEHLGY